MPRPLSLTRDAAVGEQGHVDGVGVAGQRLVDRVVDDLPDQVVQAALTGRPDVHAGPLADRLQALEDLDRLGVVGRGFGRVVHRCGPGPCGAMSAGVALVSSASDTVLLCPPPARESAVVLFMTSGPPDAPHVREDVRATAGRL